MASEHTAHISAERLQEYARGELSTTASRTVEEHIAHCPRCRKLLTSGLRHAPSSPPPPSIPPQRRAPPTVDVHQAPDTVEVSEIPSQVSVMHVPTSVRTDEVPSTTSLTTAGIGPLNRAPRRRRRSRRLGLLAGAAALLVAAAVGTYVVAIRPRARSEAIARRAGEELELIGRSVRLEELQHPRLTGDVPYRPGADPELTGTLVRLEQDLQRAVDADGSNVQARLDLALVHLLNGDPRVARQQYQEAGALQGPGPALHMGLGILDVMAARVANDPADVAYALEQADGHFGAIQLGDPGYPEAIYDRAVVAHERGDDDEARRLLQVYAEIQPRSTWIAELQGRIQGGSDGAAPADGTP